MIFDLDVGHGLFFSYTFMQCTWINKKCLTLKLWLLILKWSEIGQDVTLNSNKLYIISTV